MATRCGGGARLEAVITIALMLTFVVAAPLLGITAGRLAGASGLARVRAESGWREVPAVLLVSERRAWLRKPETAMSPAPAGWTAPAGGARKGIIAVDPNAQAGARVQIWLPGPAS